jgi:nitrite reductase (NADH) small subunit
MNAHAVTDLTGPTDRPVGFSSGWTPVCRWDDLVPDRGVRALVAGSAVAVLRCSFADGLYAIDDHDPYTGTSVLSRGLVGMTIEATPFVASPLRKQRFDLRTGRSLEDPSTAVSVWPVRVADGVVLVADEPFCHGASSGGNGGETSS